MWIRRLRWWRAALLTALAVVGLVLAASWVILRVYGPAFTRERVEAALSEALGQPAHVGAVHLRPWRGRVSLVDLDVPARATPPGGVRPSRGGHRRRASTSPACGAGSSPSPPSPPISTSR